MPLPDPQAPLPSANAAEVAAGAAPARVERGPTPPRSRRWAGTLIAVLVAIAVAALAWYLTHRPPQTAPSPAGAAARGAFGAPGASGASGASSTQGARAGGGAPAGAGAGRGGPTNTVGVATARHANIPVTIDALGTVTSAATVTVAPQVSGVITQILYREGQMVSKGQVLAVIDPKPYEAALAQATGARMRDEASLQAAQVMLSRYRTLLAQDSIARQTVDTQAAQVQQLTATVALDRANEQSARLNVQWSRVVAPVAGRVGLRPIDAGNYISAGAASGIATITQIAPIDVAFSIPQERVPQVQDGMRRGALPVTVWDSSRVTQLDTGRFDTLDNQIDTSTGTIKAKARFANAQGTLFPNQFVNVRLLLSTIDAAVVVPVTALRHGPSGDYVYVVGADRTVELRPVNAGISGVDDVAIQSGLAVGEVVVTEGADRLKDGSRVQTPAAAASGSASGAARGGRRGAAAGAGPRSASSAAPVSAVAR